MSVRVKIFLFILIGFALLGWGKYLIPSRAEITQIGVLEIIGIDSKEDNGVSLSICIEGESGNEEDSKKKNKEIIVSSQGKSFNDCVNGFENYSDKIFVGGHIKNAIIGEEMARQNLVRAVDFLSKASEIRLNCTVFIAKNSSASDLMKDGLNNQYVLADKVSNINITDKTFTMEKNTNIFDSMNILISEDKCGVIPTLEVVGNGEAGSREFILGGSKDGDKILQFAGYGLIKDAKLIDFLDIETTSGYDFIKNKFPKSNIHIEKDGEVIGINFSRSKTDISFTFDNEILKEIVIKTKTKNDVLQSSDGKNIFKEDLDEIERLLEAEIVKRIEKAIYLEKYHGVDYLEFSKVLNLKHPYKWNKIKDDWENIFREVPIKVEVEANINRSYDVLSIINE